MNDDSISVAARWNERRVVVTVTGSVDLVTAPELESLLDSVISENPRDVIVDLTDVDSLASAGMSVLTGAYHKLGPERPLSVVADGPATARPLTLVGFADIIPIYQTLDAALAGRPHAQPDPAPGS
ncbi:STAS domain-containing protein [Skermania sp. ID1734]|uniref:STAS domain-containing protein n=1 Tax=Skermania sp. ID1734 TaxID=2597516 RepID=UPI002101DB9C|nr:STAS domain-containing protein [Skermania sp. ID1734]